MVKGVNPIRKAPFGCLKAVALAVLNDPWVPPLFRFLPKAGENVGIRRVLAQLALRRSPTDLILHDNRKNGRNGNRRQYRIKRLVAHLNA